jgi:hypothetical protein
MEQMILDGICIISFYIAGTVGLLVAGEFIYKFYEIIAPAISKKVSGLFSPALTRMHHRPFHGCCCRTFPIRQKG